MIPVECHYGDHLWQGTSVCRFDCGARLRCGCGQFVREDGMDAHLDSGKCPMVTKALAEATP